MDPSESKGPSKGFFQCSECARSYTRVDHLARHVRSHLQEKPFTCPVCNKGFGRPDLLKRHAAGHDADGNTPKRQKRTLTQTSRVSQACKSCAYAKLKCEDQKPCKRCLAKGIACEYNSEHRTPTGTDAPVRAMSQADAPNLTPTLEGSMPLTANASDTATDGQYEQMPTPSTLTQPTLAAPMPPAAMPPPITSVPQQLHLQENYFCDFLRNVMTPADASPFGVGSPSNWPSAQDFEPRNVLDFGVDTSMDFDANDFGLLDSFNGRAFNHFDSFSPMLPDHGVSPNAPRGKMSIPLPPIDPRQRVALGTDAFKKSSWSRWQPAKGRDNASAEHVNLSIPAAEAGSADGRYRVEQHVLRERLTQSSRDKILAMILGTCEPGNVAPVVASFPTTDLLDDLLQCFFAVHSSRAEVDSFIHVPTFSPNAVKPELLAVLIAAGAVLTDIRALQKLGLAMQDAVRMTLPRLCEQANEKTRELHLVQAFMLELQIGLFSGQKRKMEIAESHQQVLYTMLRRAGRFRRSSIANIVPLAQDSGQTLHRKWLAWVEQESFRRLVFHAFIFDAQSSMSLLVNPIISYAELGLPLPSPRDLWDAENATQWKAIFLSLRRDPTTLTNAKPLTLIDCFNDPTALTKSLHLHDAQFAGLVILHGLWATIWELIQLLSISKLRDTGNYASSLLHTHRRDDALRTLSHLKISFLEWPAQHQVQPCPEIRLMLDLLSLYLHMHMEDIQLFAGKEDADEARRVLPALQQWSESTYSWHSVWHAGQVLRNAKGFPRKGLRGFYAIAVLHSSLAFWTYGVILQTRPPGDYSTLLPDVWLDGGETADVQRFTALGRGRPGLTASSPAFDNGGRPTTPQTYIVPLSDPQGAMDVVVEMLRSNWESRGNGERVTPPSLVENVIQLIRDLGAAAGAVVH
ncbi:hypothetical protein K490DRAFT_69422 [Saccharata proteae CBS 121410]|uniref:C6 transcription factor RegA n=1 Tax=Saccharata proteae CBS 121410 TaxID=1314787 RepID=A0A9P4LV76_9PEZI|nr:hypothetical protein K490DRAFT_69422 [Saccharata proteae CBS 121410]